MSNNINWNSDEGDEDTRNSRKRTAKEPSRTNKKKKRKLNNEEDVDIDSDEATFKDKVFDRYTSRNLVCSINFSISFQMFIVMKIQIWKYLMSLQLIRKQS